MNEVLRDVIVSAPSPRPVRLCYICADPNHLADVCPQRFQSTKPSMAPKEAKPALPTGPKFFPASRSTACKDFNIGSCSSPCPNRQLLICALCFQSDHPAVNHESAVNPKVLPSPDCANALPLSIKPSSCVLFAIPLAPSTPLKPSAFGKWLLATLIKLKFPCLLKGLRKVLQLVMKVPNRLFLIDYRTL